MRLERDSHRIIVNKQTKNNGVTRFAPQFKIPIEFHMQFLYGYAPPTDLNPASNFLCFSGSMDAAAVYPVAQARIL